jgi:hypothetical protein
VALHPVRTQDVQLATKRGADLQGMDGQRGTRTASPTGPRHLLLRLHELLMPPNMPQGALDAQPWRVRTELTSTAHWDLSEMSAAEPWKGGARSTE